MTLTRKHYIIGIEPLDGEDTTITTEASGESGVTIYAVISADSTGASIVDNGYRSIAEARIAWPDAIAPNPAQHMTPREAEKQAVLGEQSQKRLGAE